MSRRECQKSVACGVRGVYVVVHMLRCRGRAAGEGCRERRAERRMGRAW
jgi:hypothetical protein